MIHALLRGYNGQLLVFAEDPRGDRIGPYRELAPALLALPAGQVRWMAEQPDGRLLLDVPATFVTALIDGKPEEAARLLLEAMNDAGARNRCPEPQPHGRHEWYGIPAAIRRICPGR